VASQLRSHRLRQPTRRASHVTPRSHRTAVRELHLGAIGRTFGVHIGNWHTFVPASRRRNADTTQVLARYIRPPSVAEQQTPPAESMWSLAICRSQLGSESIFEGTHQLTTRRAGCGRAGETDRTPESISYDPTPVAGRQRRQVAGQLELDRQNKSRTLNPIAVYRGFGVGVRCRTSGNAQGKGRGGSCGKKTSITQRRLAAAHEPNPELAETSANRKYWEETKDSLKLRKLMEVR
jgi:hypothetical protein